MSDLVKEEDVTWEEIANRQYKRIEKLEAALRALITASNNTFVSDPHEHSALMHATADAEQVLGEDDEH